MEDKFLKKFQKGDYFTYANMSIGIIVAKLSKHRFQIKWIHGKHFYSKDPDHACNYSSIAADEPKVIKIVNKWAKELYEH